MWLVTREASEGQPLVDALRRRGRDAVCVPAIRRAPLVWPFALTDADLVFVTSPYAAQLVVEHLGDARPRCAAVAPATRAVLARAHVDVAVSAEGGAVALAEACVAAGVRGRVLYPTSDAGLLQEEQRQAHALLARTCTVERAAVYTTVEDARLDDNLRLLRGPFGALLFSPSAARALHAALTRTGVRGLTHAVTVGASTGRAWLAASGRAAMEAPPRVDIVDFVCSLEDP